jgi:SanA protein
MIPVKANRPLLIIVTCCCVFALSGAGVFLILCQWLVYAAGENRVFEQIDNVPENEVGLVLGTAKWAAKGRLNRFFSYRMDAALRLYQSGKVRRLLLSGNGTDPGQREPEQMKTDLIARGIPAGALDIDNGGIRTLDSITRAKRVYGLDRMTIVSQEFHNRRALFFCRALGIDAVGSMPKGSPLPRLPAHCFESSSLASTPCWSWERALQVCKGQYWAKPWRAPSPLAPRNPDGDIV